MNIVIADYESYYHPQDYSVTKLGTEAYIRDPRFEAHGCAIKWNPEQPAIWYPREQLDQVMRGTDWSDTFIIHHHAQFDAAISSWHYDAHPHRIGCTLAMSRMVLGNHISVSLDSVRKHFGLAPKTTPYNLFAGRRWHEIDEPTRRLIGEGACDEVESIWKIFQILMQQGFPAEELDTIDTTIKMFSEPCLRADTTKLASIWESEVGRKERMLAELSIDEADLQSAEAFAQLLRAEGVEPEMKDGKNGLIYAFAKTDPFMKQLQEDEDERIRGLVEARLGCKSTFLQTRVEALGWMASRGSMPVYLHMYGAHTTRWSGGDGVNWQNLNALIEGAIIPPDGYWAYQVDAAQIECIAEGQLVRTRDKGFVPIEVVSVDDFVWDGIEWVSHQGVIFKGVKEVITYQSLTATPDHIIYTREFPHGAPLGYLAENGCDLAAPRPAAAICAATMLRAALRGLQNLRSAWSKIQFPQCEGRCFVGNSESPSSQLQKSRDRSNRQRRSLRAWKLATLNTAAKRQQQIHHFLGSDRRQTYGDARFQTSVSRMWVQPRPDKIFSREAPPDWRADYIPLQACVFQNDMASKNAKAPTLQSLERKTAKVYDILNAGPRRQFEVSGVIVSNCRVLNHVAGQTDKIEEFRNGLDPYIGVASAFAGFRVNKIDHPELRQAGKVVELQAGYGSGGEKIRQTLRTKAGILITPEEGEKYKMAYRDTHPKVVELWGVAGRMLGRLAGGPPLDWEPVTLKDGKMFLPNGTWINYTTLEYHRDDEYDDSYWRLKTRRGWSKIYGAKLVENLIQALARVVISQAMTRIKKSGYRVINTKHDSMWILIPRDGREKEHARYIESEMCVEPAWLKGIPLGAEGFLGERYAKT